MKIFARVLTLAIALCGGNASAQENPKVDWNAEYENLLKSEPGVRAKIERGQATKEEVIQWLKENRGKQAAKAKLPKKNAQQTKPSAFQEKLAALVAAGKISKEDAQKLAATMSSDATEKKQGKPKSFDAIYEKFLAENAEVRKKVESGQVSKQQVIEFLKRKAAGNSQAKGKTRTQPGARPGSVKLYAIVIGQLKSKDIELGELELEVDYLIGKANWVKKDLVGQRVKLVGVAGAFLDNLLRIKRGETIKVRIGDYNPKTKVLGFGYKFQVLERTPPFDPADFGVPPSEFRGFNGRLVGKIVESEGYEVLLLVKEIEPAADNNAENAESIVGKRIRVDGFYDQHADMYSDLHEGDTIRVSVRHRDLESDAVTVTKTLKLIENKSER